jgi:hypothetical protein
VRARSLSLSLLFALGAFHAAHAANESKDPEVSFEQKRVTARSVTKGGRVAFYSVGLAGDGYTSMVKQVTEVLTDTDKDSTVFLDVPDNVPLRSVWVVIDTQSGRYTLAVPPGMELRLDNRPKAFMKSKGNEVDLIASPGVYADVLYMRPNGDISVTSAIDGEHTDVDGRGDRIVTVDLDQLQPVDPNAGKPAEITAGGVIVVIDRWDMLVYVAKIDGSVIKGAK